MFASPTLLFSSGQLADGTWNLFAIDKRTGERVGAVEIKADPIERIRQKPRGTGSSGASVFLRTRR